VNVLVTGAEGFAGRRLVEALGAAGHEVTAAVRPGLTPPPGVKSLPLELGDADSVRALARAGAWDRVAHLAAVASGADAMKDPGLAWTVNAAGTARLLSALAECKAAGEADPIVLLVSTGEVYRRGEKPHAETDPVQPCSPYAASKLAAEIAAGEIAARTGLMVSVARSFPHTGPGQDTRFVLPAFAQRLKAAKRAKARVIKVGNLEPVRDVLDVRDVVRAYVALLELPKRAMGIYNVASGTGHSMQALLEQLAAVVGVDVIPEADPALMRASDLPHLVGDATKLKSITGWAPRIALETTLKDLVDAQAN